MPTDKRQDRLEAFKASYDRVMKLVFWGFAAIVALFLLACLLNPDTDTPR